MVMPMSETLIGIISIFLEAIALSVCVLAVFREKRQLKRRDFLFFPLMFLCFGMARLNVTVGAAYTALGLKLGFSFVPVDNVLLFIILIIGVLLISSTLLKIQDGKQSFCGTMAAFSMYLLCRFGATLLLLLFDMSELGLQIGSGVLTLLLVGVAVNLPWFSALRGILQSGTFLVQLVSANIALFFMAVFTIVSFNTERFRAHLYAVGIALLLLLLLDSVLLFFNARREEERKRIRMIEQYVPIVEELISQVRARQHEFSNRMLTIEMAVSSAESLSEAQKNVAALTQGLALSMNDRALLSCDSKIISGLIFGKIKQAEMSGISVCLALGGCFRKTALSETVWVEIVGILLDNAIEASKRGDTIWLQSTEEDHALALCVSNPHLPLSGTEFMNLFRRGISTKNGSSRGYGLYQIQRLTERCSGKIITRNEVRDGKNYVVFGVRFS